MSNNEEKSVESQEQGQEKAPEQLQSTPPPPRSPKASPKATVPPPPAVYKTGINKRLDEALKHMKRVNRSSDLVPLNHDYDLMRKELKALIAAAKTYKANVLSMDKARTDMVTKLGSLSAKSPIFSEVGDTKGEDSFASITQAASKNTHDLAAGFQDQILDYCIEWEHIISSRVDQGLEETIKLRERLMHYENKAEGLRKVVNAKDDTKKGVPLKLKEKLERNEKKLEIAWKAHERSASMLCNLLQQVTKRGWKDLAPLILNSIQWEVESAAGQYDIFARLPAIGEAMMESAEKASVPYAEEDNVVPVALLADDVSVGSDTTGSHVSIAEEDTTVDLTEAPMTPEPTKKEMEISKDAGAMPASPDRVLDFEEKKGVEV